MITSAPTPGVSIFTSPMVATVTSPSFSPTSSPPDTNTILISSVIGVIAILSLLGCVCCIAVCCITCMKRKRMARNEAPEEARAQMLEMDGMDEEPMARRMYETYGPRLPLPGGAMDPLCRPVRQDVHVHVQTSTKEINNSIRGVEVIGETDFVISTKECSFEWVGYGLRLSIPEDSLPTGMEQCRINIKASLFGPFLLPEDSDLLSPVFWISALCKFRKPVTLEIQHCASRDEATFADLNFVSTKCSQKDLPYIFKQLDGGRFPADSFYGSIQLTHFSGIGVTGRKRTPRSYCAQIYYTIKEEASDWRVYFIITKDLDALKTIVRKHYGHFAKQEATLRIRFEHSKITLDIPEDGQVTKEGWRITPRTHPTISRKDVDHFEPGLCMPECELLVEWELKDQKPIRLRHRVNLIGAREPYNFFHLNLNPAWKEVVRHQSTSSRGSVDHGQDQSDYPAGFDSEPELRKLMNEVAAKIPGKWRDVGLQLGVDQSILDGIATISLGDTNLCYSNVFTRWKNQNSTAHPYTWSTIVQALKAPAVGEERLADKISAMLGH